MEFLDILKDRIFIIPNEITKKDLIDFLCEEAYKTGNIKSLEELKEKVFYRETLMSTGLGLGLAISHVRMKGVKEPTIIMAIVPKGVKDYESIDDSIVKIVILIVLPEKKHKEHIKLLSEIVELFKDDKVRENILKVNNKEDAINFLDSYRGVK